MALISTTISTDNIITEEEIQRLINQKKKLLERRKRYYEANKRKILDGIKIYKEKKKQSDPELYKKKQREYISKYRNKNKNKETITNEEQKL